MTVFFRSLTSVSQVADVKAKRFGLCSNELGLLGEGEPFKPRTRMKTRQVHDAGVAIKMSAEDVLAAIAEAVGTERGDFQRSLRALNCGQERFRANLHAHTRTRMHTHDSTVHGGPFMEATPSIAAAVHASLRPRLLLQQSTHSHGPRLLSCQSTRSLTHPFFDTILFFFHPRPPAPKLVHVLRPNERTNQ